MNYEIENKLRDKADNWEIHNLKTEIDHLKQDIRDMIYKNDYLQNRINNHARALEDLINLLLFKETDQNNDNILQQLKQYLY